MEPSPRALELNRRILRLISEIDDETHISTLIIKQIDELNECIENLKSGKTAVSFSEFHIIKAEITSLKDLLLKNQEKVSKLNSLLKSFKDELAKLQKDSRKLSIIKT